MTNWCFNCNKNTKTKNIFKSWDQSNYFICKICDCANLIDKNIIEYENDYWGDILDPDGNKRNLLDEQQFKIKNWYGEIIDFINQLPKNQKVLDYGSGLGNLLSALDSNFEKYAVDISMKSIDYIKDKLPKVNAIHLSDFQGRYQKNFFDIIIAYHVIEHTENPHKMISDLSSLLKTNGILIIGTPNRSCLAESIFKGNFRLYSKEHLIIFSKQSLRNLISKYNFKIFKEEYPYFKTKYFNLKNLLRMLFPKKISPPFYGNIMTFYAKKI